MALERDRSATVCRPIATLVCAREVNELRKTVPGFLIGSAMSIKPGFGIVLAEIVEEAESRAKIELGCHQYLAFYRRARNLRSSRAVQLSVWMHSAAITWRQQAVPVCARCDAIVAFERLAERNLRVISDEPGNLRELPWAGSQIDGGLVEPPAREVTQWRFVHQATIERALHMDRPQHIRQDIFRLEVCELLHRMPFC